MLTPNITSRVPIEEMPSWAADTGLYSAKGAREFELSRYIEWLQQRRRFISSNLFATAPDSFGSWSKTIEMALPVLPVIRSIGYQAALVAQPGITLETIPWQSFDCLFIGGPDEHQHGPIVRGAIREARRRGKTVHGGRVNGYKRLSYFYKIGAHSVDGTFVAFAPKTNIERLRKWYRLLAPRSYGQYQLSIFRASRSLIGSSSCLDSCQSDSASWPRQQSI